MNYSTNLLEKLIKNEQLNTLVLNLYPSKGYTLGFNIKLTVNNSNITKQTENEIIKLNKVETNLITYAENELLYYVNSGEIPPIIIDLVDRLNVSLALLLLQWWNFDKILYLYCINKYINLCFFINIKKYKFI